MTGTPRYLLGFYTILLLPYYNLGLTTPLT